MFSHIATSSSAKIVFDKMFAEIVKSLLLMEHSGADVSQQIAAFYSMEK